jgi:hypothetical protein
MATLKTEVRKGFDVKERPRSIVVDLPGYEVPTGRREGVCNGARRWFWLEPKLLNSKKYD